MAKQKKSLQKQFDEMNERCSKKLEDLLHAAGYSEPTQEQLDWFNDDRNHCSAADMMPRISSTPIKKAMDNIDEFLKQGYERMQQYIDELRKENPTEPVIIEGRPFTPDDLQHLDDLNEEMLKQNPSKPYQWKKGMLSHIEWEERYLQRPITIPTPDPTDEKIEE